ncbi:unnamed protein product [Pleuronectes platessa]|uniref:Uncharacterized protein n=1 Tax=Pleuronectes platessa TaxID=8262 RepID=A0A9N7UNE6_PLEPL|nr:unnamed protein product [Pleuronectes platessa]
MHITAHQVNLLIYDCLMQLLPPNDNLRDPMLELKMQEDGEHFSPENSRTLDMAEQHAAGHNMGAGDNQNAVLISIITRKWLKVDKRRETTFVDVKSQSLLIAGKLLQ